MEIIVYSKENCMQCRMVKRLLTLDNVTFSEVDVTSDEKALNMLKEKGFMSLPVTQQGDLFIQGFKPEQLKGLAS